ncbi:MAG: bifunctional glutamate N-acetyltransferase/amino-acid acetyltransferase ArgJ [Deltaproteobacteria bacterium]
MSYAFVPDGGVTTPLGFEAGGAYAGIKKFGSDAEGRKDVGLLVARNSCVATALFTTNRVCGAPVTVSKDHLADRRARAIVVNSGCSNVAMGARGIEDARAMARAAATHLGVPEREVLVASTGVIARPLPLDRVQRGIAAIQPSREGGLAFSQAILTTDRVIKRRAVRFEVGGRTYTVGGTAKGSGMAHPNLATVLCFLTTDAPLDPSWAAYTLKHIADRSLNMLNIDLDTSTSDSLFWLASGEAGGDPVTEGHAAAEPLYTAVHAVCEELTRDLARDGEGARTLIQVEVVGARSEADARKAAHTIVSSPLVKTMVTGRDPNIGRILMAAGRSGAELSIERISIKVNGVLGYAEGTFIAENEGALRKAMDSAEVLLRVDLGMLGTQQATAWGCDLTDDYVHINADYTT